MPLFITSCLYLLLLLVVGVATAAAVAAAACCCLLLATCCCLSITLYSFVELSHLSSMMDAPVVVVVSALLLFSLSRRTSKLAQEQNQNIRTKKRKINQGKK